MTGLKRNLPPSVFAELLTEQSSDQALERCEDAIITAWRTDRERADERRALLLETTGDDLERFLDRQIVFEELVEKLRPWLEPRDYATGANIAGPDTKREGLELLVAGRASICDAAGTRQRQCTPGDLIWSSGAWNEKAASVIADEPCRTVLLTPAVQLRLEEHEEKLALKLYRYLLH